MKITTLVENSAGSTPGTAPEFGLSQLIETAGKKILLDTGATGLFLKNAGALGVDIASVDLA
ncbi:MAG: MBL fold metallo-hydrolase, partial [Myxococcota bacterium]